MEEVGGVVEVVARSDHPLSAPAALVVRHDRRQRREERGRLREVRLGARVRGGRVGRPDDADRGANDVHRMARGGQQVDGRLHVRLQRASGTLVLPGSQRTGKLQPHLGVRVVHEPKQCAAEVGAAGQQSLAQPDGMAADAGMPVEQGVLNEGRLECTKAVEHTQGLQARRRPRVVPRQRLQQRHGGPVLPPDEHLPGQVALRAIDAVQCPHQPRRVELVER